MIILIILICLFLNFLMLWFSELIADSITNSSFYKHQFMANSYLNIEDLKNKLLDMPSIKRKLIIIFIFSIYGYIRFIQSIYWIYIYEKNVSKARAEYLMNLCDTLAEYTAKYRGKKFVNKKYDLEIKVIKAVVNNFYYRKHSLVPIDEESIRVLYVITNNNPIEFTYGNMMSIYKLEKMFTPIRKKKLYKDKQFIVGQSKIL